MSSLHTPQQIRCANYVLRVCLHVVSTEHSVEMVMTRFPVPSSKDADSHTVAYQQQDAFCKSKGGRLPTSWNSVRATTKTRRRRRLSAARTRTAGCRTPAARTSGCTSVVLARTHAHTRTATGRARTTRRTTANPAGVKATSMVIWSTA